MNANAPTRYHFLFLLIGVVGGVAICFSYLSVDSSLFYRAYLFAFLFALGLALGSLALIMLHNLTGGDWGTAIRPTLHAAALTLPLLALLFLFIAFNLSALYPWARSDTAASELLVHRAAYFTLPFFFARAVCYFAVWIALAFLVVRDGPVSRGLNAAGLILYLFTMTHAGFDWIMSRDTHFYSTAFGFIITLGQTLSAMAFAVLVMPKHANVRSDSPEQPQRPPLFNDIGNILLTLVILWMYVSFMQFLVIWMGNSGEDNSYYLQRGFSSENGASLAWRIIGAFLIVFHFFVPFFLLLFRSAKHYRPMLSGVAGLLLIAHIIEQYWLIAPSDHARPQFEPAIVDALAFIAILAFWLFGFFFIRSRRPMIWQPPHSSDGEAHAHA